MTYLGLKTFVRFCFFDSTKFFMRHTFYCVICFRLPCSFSPATLASIQAGTVSIESDELIIVIFNRHGLFFLFAALARISRAVIMEKAARTVSVQASLNTGNCPWPLQARAGQLQLYGFITAKQTRSQWSMASSFGI